MAIDEKKRENLLGEATAYSRRMLVSVAGLTFGDQSLEQLFAGVRADGRWSLYYDESPVIQLDSQGRLRRLFILPDKFAAERGRLVQLNRPGQVSPGQVNHPGKGGRIELDRQPIGKEREVLLFTKLRVLLERTREHLASSSDIDSKLRLGNYPPEDVLWFDDLVAVLERLVKNLEIAPGL